MNKFSNIYFWNKTLYVSDSSLVYHQEFFTVHAAMVYVIQVCWQLANRIRIHTDLLTVCSLAVTKPLWHTPLLCVQWKTPDDGQRNCPKHVEFYSKNKFGKINASSWFIIRIYHDVGHLNVKFFYIPQLCIIAQRKIRNCVGTWRNNKKTTSVDWVHSTTTNLICCMWSHVTGRTSTGRVFLVRTS